MKHQPKVSRTCQRCHRPFTVLACIARIKPAKYCSFKCWMAAHRTAKIVQCSYCGHNLLRAAWEISRHCKYGPFCNHVCLGYWLAKNLVGKKSPNWKNAKSWHYLGRWKRQRQLAKQRDQFTCRKCHRSYPAKSNALVVHHIVPYHHFKIPNHAHALNNLLTLCRPCHGQCHRK